MQRLKKLQLTLLGADWLFWEWKTTTEIKATLDQGDLNEL